MTIGTKMHQTLASLEGAAANLQQFALETECKQTKGMFSQMNKQLEDINRQLQDRVNFIEQQEPQYQVNEQNMQQQQQQQQ